MIFKKGTAALRTHFTKIIARFAFVYTMMATGLSLRSLSAMAFAVLIASGCSGLSHMVPFSNMPGGGDSTFGVQQSSASLSAVFTVQLPKQSGTATYPARSLTVESDGVLSTLQGINFPADPKCVGISTALMLCTVHLSLTYGEHVLQIVTYDQPLSGTSPPSNAKKLSTDRVPLDALPSNATGGILAVHVALYQSPVSLAITPENSLVVGSQSAGFTLLGELATGLSAAPFGVVALDQAKDIIVGPGAPALKSASSSNPAFKVAVGTYDAFSVTAPTSGTAPTTSVSVTDTLPSSQQCPTAACSATVTLRAGNPNVLDSASVQMSTTGGTITLATGSSVTIPSGMLATTQTVTLELLSSPAVQTPNRGVISASPALVLSWPGTLNALSRVESGSSGSSGSSTSTLDFTLSASGAFGSASSITLVDLVDVNGKHNFLDPPWNTINTTTASGSVPASLVTMSQSPITFYVAKDAPYTPSGTVPGPTGFSVYTLDTSLTFPSWRPFKASDVKTSDSVAILVHGMNSQLDSAFNASTAWQIRGRGPYNVVLGVSYDWTQMPAIIQPQFSAFLNTLDSQTKDVDLWAHSYGTIVTLAALDKSTLRPDNVVLLGGPLLGTPLANVNWLTTFSVNATYRLLGYTIPYQSYSTLAKFYQFNKNGVPLLLRGSPALAQIVDPFALSAQNQKINVVKVAGNTGLGKNIAEAYAQGFLTKSSPLAFWGPATGQVITDGIIPLYSAMDSKIAGPAEQFPLNHIELESDQNVAQYVGANLRLFSVPITVTPNSVSVPASYRGGTFTQTVTVRQPLFKGSFTSSGGCDNGTAFYPPTPSTVVPLSAKGPSATFTITVTDLAPLPYPHNPPSVTCAFTFVGKAYKGNPNAEAFLYFTFQ